MMYTRAAIIAQYKTTYNSGRPFSGTRTSIDVNRFIKEIKGKQKILLDAGCGDGRAATLLTKQGYCVIGVDVSRAALRLAIQKKQSKCVFVLADLTNSWCFNDQSFDGIFSRRTLADIAKRNKLEITLAEANRTLKRSGILYFSTYLSIRSSFTMTITGFSAASLRRTLTKNFRVLRDAMSYHRRSGFRGIHYWALCRKN